MTLDQANTVIKTYEPQVVLATYNILFTNDIVCGRVIEDMEALAKTAYCKFRVKAIARQITAARHEYERLLNEILAERSEFFANANDAFTEEVDRHVTTLYFSIKREFDRHRITDSDLIARMETTRTLCDFACQQFDLRMEELATLDARFRVFRLRYLRLTNLTRLYGLLMPTFRIPCTVDLNTADCLLAIDILARKLVDGNIIAKAIETKIVQ